MHELTVTAIGKDRPGIVASVSRAFLDLRCNLAECSMTRLRDQFAMILVVQAPQEVTNENLLGTLEGSAGHLDLQIQVFEGPHEASQAPKRPFVISLYGADHPGIVHRVTQELAGQQVNITDLVSRVAGDNVYLMVLEVDLPDSLDEAALAQTLDDVAGDLEVDITLRPAEAADL